MSLLEFYGIKGQPFSNAPDNRFYFNSEQHSHALLRLKYAVDSMKGLAVLIGDIGTGKTTLARRMLDELPEEEYESALLIIIHSSVTAEWLLKKISVQLGVKDVADTKMEIISQLYQRLVQIHEAGKKPVVLIDEAQMLNSRDLMEEFRGLLNIENTDGKLLSLIFFGMSGLNDCLALDPPLQQRVAVKYKLKSLDADATEAYIRHRLSIVGCETDLFTPEAYRSIYEHSHGIPRLINTICDNALFEGFLVKKKVVGEDLIQEVAEELDLEKKPVGMLRETDEEIDHIIERIGEETKS
ncbi:MAG: AAA family ATPase [Nitrospirae bacterium CG_4_9_14_3_um_filter_53_35]|nr:MAG: AAA family ATPase [Nitrospirae bacterium CG2_30_53_67]PIS37855.1 MAG: AAA family ATPase [Nitrospirae bacterium CG08_land_8_20_14_0_20_52_24]PIV85743.1 MAG: AAA family ATPase [Nitrospirae bacterium CG17_big_fil_post_rev_8_21_14_2_50_50_9]PIW86141.1 MAG: AAA family ATPase [Nitrospirae bacterium CG_4_8_14_3_um_filter_50_41]PIX85374.1 MAG: AAA family ATPase [Nitrospirae bacterium CG_4_10_14_3_um_filter_53_41]PJA72753.1 MAG: AAA family ATPase [Nitrospirae bacterium CG_4_9_14_3_um_filter_53_